MTVKRPTSVTHFEARSVMLMARWRLSAAGTAFAQNAPATLQPAARPAATAFTVDRTTGDSAKGRPLQGTSSPALHATHHDHSAGEPTPSLARLL